MKAHLTKTHLLTFAVMLSLFTMVTLWITITGVDHGPGRYAYIVLTTAGTITGPLTGAISRGFQQCCLEFSLTVMAFAGPVLLVCLVLQFVRLGNNRLIAALRLGLWILGWLAWFLGGILSFGHALS